jgi:hypothetical protein
MYVIICDTIWNYGNQLSLRQVDANELLAVPPGTEVEMTPRDWYCAWCNCADVQAGAENCGATWGQQVQKPWTSNNINNRSAESFGSNCFSRSKFSLSQEDKDQQQLTKLGFLRWDPKAEPSLPEYFASFLLWLDTEISCNSALFRSYA